MGDKETLARARKELEELYLGVPDDSVNLTFQDFAQVRQLQNAENKKLSPSSTSKNSQNSPSTLTKLPSLDFSRGLQSSFQSSNNHHNLHHNRDEGAGFRASGGQMYNGHDHHHAGVHSHQYHHGHRSLHNGDQQRSMVYDDMSYVSGVSTVAYGREGGHARRRPGIPHSNICTVCCNYIYVFRHRCLCCGRAYCRQCVSIGMGEMTEGRKCIDCLGRRFSQRYVQKAGNMGCCMGYSSTIKQQELKWAEKGPRRSGENRYGHSAMVSRSRSPAMGAPSTPTLRPHSPTNPPSFVASSPYSPYTPTTHHPLPF